MIKKVLSAKHPVKIWTKDIDEKSIKQLTDIAQLPFIYKHIAVMPDVHLGIGATIGSVIATKGAIVPAAVGVDLGCGMIAEKTNLKASELPDNLKELRDKIEKEIPHGRTDNGGKNDKGGWREYPEHIISGWNTLKEEYLRIIRKHPKAESFNNIKHLGTLGGGNHFIEICIDEDDFVWVMLHSGSRGCGNRIGMYFINKAKEEMERYHINSYLPNKDTSYFVEKTEIFDDYVSAVEWSQNFAATNREIMMTTVIDSLRLHTKKSFKITQQAINCHHNYISRENHFGSNVIVTRKGAIRARKDELGIIPGSMGDKSFIVRGLGNKESFCSCSHGAGRAMSRTEAKRRFTKQDLIEQTKGVECPKDDARIDEIPSSYKSIESVMKNQEDLVEIVATLKQVLNVKG